MQKTSPRVLVSIINWNNNAATTSCLASIAKIDRPLQPDILLVDNGSRQQPLDVSDALHRSLRSLTIRYNAQNLGFGVAHNDSIKQGVTQGYDYVVLLNNDTQLLDLELFAKLCAALEADSHAIAAAPTVLSSTNPYIIWYGGGLLNAKIATTQHLRLGDKYRLNQEPKSALPTTFITGCCVAIKATKIARDADYLPDDYFVYWEDAEWCHRVSQLGHTLLYVPDAYLLHHTSSSLGFRSSGYIYYNIRNNLLFIKRNTPIGFKTIARLHVGWISAKYCVRIALDRPFQARKLQYILKAWKDGLVNKGGPIE